MKNLLFMLVVACFAFSLEDKAVPHNLGSAATLSADSFNANFDTLGVWSGRWIDSIDVKFMRFTDTDSVIDGDSGYFDTITATDSIFFDKDVRFNDGVKLGDDDSVPPLKISYFTGDLSGLSEGDSIAVALPNSISASNVYGLSAICQDSGAATKYILPNDRPAYAGPGEREYFVYLLGDKDSIRIKTDASNSARIINRTVTVMIWYTD